MKKNNLFMYALLAVISFTIFSCKKTSNNILTGSWQLTAHNITRIDTVNSTTFDTTRTNASYNINHTQQLEFNSNNTYSLSNYAVTPSTVSYGKYTFTGNQTGGTIVRTPNNSPTVPIVNAFIIIPSTGTANAMLVFPTETNGAGYSIADT